MKKYRNEFKFILPAATLSKIESRLSGAMDTDRYGDENGNYVIHSLYMDDLYDSAVSENGAGVSNRYKYRIRFYNESTDFIRLERKEKQNNLCHKESCIITRDEYDAICDGRFFDFAYDENRPLLRMFSVDAMTKGLSPKVIIDYERVAFVEETTNVRITIDRNVSASSDVESFLTGDYIRYPLQEKDRHVLEVKFDDILPSYLRKLVDDENLIQTSFSKYCLGRLQINRMER